MGDHFMMTTSWPEHLDVMLAVKRLPYDDLKSLIEKLDRRHGPDVVNAMVNLLNNIRMERRERYDEVGMLNGYVTIPVPNWRPGDLLADNILYWLKAEVAFSCV